MDRLLKLSAALILLISTSFTAFFFIDSRYTHLPLHTSLAQRVSLNELHQLYQKALNEFYFYQDQVRKYPDNKALRRKYEETDIEVNRLRKRIEELEK